MPVYATTQDLIDRYGEEEIVQLTDRDDPPADAVDTAVADAALEEADRMIDAYVGKRYALPVATPVPGLLKDLARNLARRYLHLFEPPDDVKAAHDRAMKMLDGISRGTVVLDAAGVQPAASGDRVRTTDPDRVFTGDSMKGF